MISLIDESVIEHPAGLVYIIAAMVIAENPDEIRDNLQDQILRNGRVRPSHWNEEGPRVRAILCAACDSVAAVGQTFVSTCGRRGQESTRVQLLTKALVWTHEEGASTLYIESRGRTLDNRDKQTVKSHALERGNTLDVHWRNKNEPLLWLADSLAGATREHLTSHGKSSLANRLLLTLHAEEPEWS